MLTIITPPRDLDDFGSGHYGASRGSRTHHGVDYAALPKSRLLSPVEGVVTKLGHPYADDLGYRYVEVTDMQEFKWRFFYVKPSVIVDDIIRLNSSLGFVQDLDLRYKGITNHIHLEIKNSDGNFINPSLLENQ